MPNRNLNKQNKGSNLHLYPTGNQSSEITNFQVIFREREPLWLLCCAYISPHIQKGKVCTQTE